MISNSICIWNKIKWTVLNFQYLDFFTSTHLPLFANMIIVVGLNETAVIAVHFDKVCVHDYFTHLPLFANMSILLIWYFLANQFKVSY